MQGIAKTQEFSQPSVQQILEKLRDNHIDVIPIILEELQEILPQYIEDIIRNVYNIEMEGVK